MEQRISSGDEGQVVDKNHGKFIAKVGYRYRFFSFFLETGWSYIYFLVVDDHHVVKQKLLRLYRHILRYELTIQLITRNSEMLTRHQIRCK
jgi:hypothetical protein